MYGHAFTKITRAQSSYTNIHSEFDQHKYLLSLQCPAIEKMNIGSFGHMCLHVCILPLGY